MNHLLLVANIGLILKLADVFTTYLALASPAGAVEKNPVVRFCINSLGLTASMALIFFLTMFLIAMLVKKCMKSKRSFSLYFVCCMMAFVVLNNLMVLYIYGII